MFQKIKENQTCQIESPSLQRKLGTCRTLCMFVNAEMKLDILLHTSIVHTCKNLGQEKRLLPNNFFKNSLIYEKNSW